jgi:UDP-glucose 4-epimerase
MMGRRILITGVSRFLGGRLARRLEKDPRVESIIGVDSEEPELDFERTEYLRADIRNPLMLRVIRTAEVDTVVHLSLVSTPTHVGGRAAMKELNVIGTMQLMAACQRTPSVRRVVTKSTTAVYGADSRDPALFTEDMSPRSTPTGYTKDAAETEQAVRDFGRRRPDVELTILRFASVLGPDVETPLTRYFSLPVIPTPAGYDPRLQLLHEDDALEILHRAALESHPGIYNVAADGVLYLSQAVRILGQIPVPVPTILASPLAAALRRIGAVDFAPDQLQFLVYGRVADPTRIRNEFGPVFRYSTRETLVDFLERGRRSRTISPELVSRWEQRVLQVLNRASAGAGRDGRWRR